jgi:GTP cyclohydrolase I
MVALILRSEEMKTSDAVVGIDTALDTPWQDLLKPAIEAYLAQNKPQHKQKELFSAYDEHTKGTPMRVVKAFAEYVNGCMKDPEVYLEKVFTAGTYDQMIHIPNIRLISMCAHHLCPIVGKAHFAYIPDGSIVGLSKIPRFIEVLARRPQVQEMLTSQIIDVFSKKVRPLGCAVHVRAYHFCMCGRGVEEPAAYTVTTGLWGNFKDEPLTRQEFLQALNKDEVIFP